MPLVFLEIFTAPAAVLQIGDAVFKMPIDWSIIVVNTDAGEAEVIPLTSLNNRGFTAFTLNPLTSFIPDFKPVDIIDIYQEVKWHFPKLKPGHFLGVPLYDTPASPCCWFIKESNKIPETIDLSKLL